MGFLTKIFGDYSKKEVKRVRPLCDKVLSLEDEYSKLTDEQLQAKTPEFKKRLAEGETLDDLLPEAFAACREASWRVLGLKHFPVQIIGGIILHQGRIAEMKTGEGKTLVATLPAYLNALSGNGVHIVTVNDYLARRDSEWMGKVYRFMGLTVGLIIHEKENPERKEAYLADITYGTNNEMGFDYLRDNMVVYKEHKVQRGHNFAIVDEVDSILIDEARTPLIISGRGEKSTDLYKLADRFAKGLKCTRIKEVNSKENVEDLVDDDCDYVVDEKAKTATLTKSGVEKAEKFFNLENLMDPDNMTIQHHINQAIKANGVMKKDIDYVVNEGEIVIVDEFTGRLMMGRRYNDGLHQAIEAKEGVKVNHESKTLASITFQNFFRLYHKLSGMTGTAMTEEDEFREIYKLDVIEIPTNRPVQRIDHPDVVYKTEAAKFRAAIEQIKECHAKGQPVLVGTISIEKSEILSKMLSKEGIKHNVLNAKQHAKEAEIVAQAGQLGAVTIATNMAGRGTDILLGGNAEFLAKADMKRMGYEDEIISEAISYADTDDEAILSAREEYKKLYAKHADEIKGKADEVRKAGGLFILGTERHESRRIDNQLRGRAGRQGDEGESRFFLSLEDDLMRLFGGDRLQMMMNNMNVDEDMPIESKMLSKVIESSQKKVEGRNFAIRKNVLNYDDVMSTQRAIIYEQRAKVLNGEDIHEYILKMIKDWVVDGVNLYIIDGSVHDEWNLSGLKAHFAGLLTTPDDFKYTPEELGKITKDDIIQLLTDRALAYYDKREKEMGSDMLRELERVILLKVVDLKWMAHIDDMEELRRGIGLRAFAQKNPVVEYRYEGFEMFDAMIESIREDTVRLLFTIQIKNNEEPQRERVAQPMETQGDGSYQSEPRRVKKVGRNDPCPCGSGKKYKNCCGRDLK